MKNLYEITICTIFSLFFCVVSNAQSSLPNEKMHIFCPEEINCLKEGSLSSCKPVGNNLEYWNKDLHESGRVVKGVYKFYNSVSSYQLPTLYSSACYYRNNEIGIEKTISIVSGRDSTLEVAYDKETKWYISGYYGTCAADSSLLCPYKELLGFGIRNESGASIKLYANDILVTPSVIEPTANGLVSYDNVSAACGEVNECVIDIKLQAGSNESLIGNILVDIKNNMKVLDVYSILPKVILVEKINPFNTILIKRADVIN